jgi:sterol O-acyltransferase
MDKAAQLVGQLNPDGSVSLEEDIGYTSPAMLKPPRSLKVALDAAAASGRNQSDTASNSGSEEDYDALKQEPGTLVRERTGRESVVHQEETNEGTYESIKPSKTRPMPPRLKTIPITLNKLKENGQYVLTTDDAAITKILQLGIERVLPCTLKNKVRCS